MVHKLVQALLLPVVTVTAHTMYTCCRFIVFIMIAAPVYMQAGIPEVRAQ